ncbi:uncharacterized protein LOC134242478 [Saccostrea cucullata]|uniref:uncharacterized protein LOC134242478 n=1 Tax=Saccostrea cuccullata TaxID=36930 RepID=UPI002ED34E4F
MAVVLKPRHSLIGKSLVPVVLKLKASDGNSEDLTLARLKRGYPLEDYSLAELRTEFEKLTGESVKDILMLAGKEDNIETVRILMSYTIEHANTVGAPRGQVLEATATASTSRDNASGSSSSTVTAQRDQPSGSSSGNSQDMAGKKDGEGLEDQLKSMKEDLKALKSRRDDLQVYTLQGQEDFTCGGGQKHSEGEKISTLEYLMERRLSYLDHLVDDTAYSRQKCSLEKEFTYFLREYRDGKGLVDANPEDIRHFLVLKDKNGKTQVHDINCQFLGKKGSFACGCPHRLAVGTVRSILGKLKPIFASYGKGFDWDSRYNIGNPVCCSSVKKYVKAIQLEQSKSHVCVQQAKPLFIRKLKDISKYIASQLENPELSLSKRYVLLRDQAFFKIQFFSGDRAHDLGLSLSQEVIILGDGKGLMFSHTVGKTLGTGKVNEFMVPRVEESLLCPVMAYRSYVEGSLDMGVNLKTGYLFRTLDPSKGSVTDYPVSSSTMFERLKIYLSVLGIDEGETPHGIRGACAITLATSGAVAGEVMEHIGWATNSSYKRYSRVGKMLEGGSVGNIMTKLATSDFDQSERVFKSLMGE